MATDAKTGQAIFPGHNSWGRTRSPKNLAGTPGTAVTLAASVVSMRGNQSGYKTVGYATENQRYLHVLLTDLNDTDPSAAPLTIFGYCHAFERWFEIPELQSTITGDNTDPSPASVLVADSGAADTTQDPAAREYRLYDIVGIDRVNFVHADSTEVAVYAACSTF